MKKCLASTLKSQNVVNMYYLFPNMDLIVYKLVGGGGGYKLAHILHVHVQPNVFLPNHC
jgi:hypothetical protein